MKNLLGVVRGQRVEEEIGYPRYLIGGTGEGAVRLRQEPDKPLPLRRLIFLHSSNDILAWILANHGQDPLNLLVVESRPDNGEDGAETPEPANGRYPFLDRKVWEEAVGVMQANEDEDEDEDEGEDEDEDEGEEERLEAESEEEPQASTRGKEPQASTRGKEPQTSTRRKEPQTSAREGTIVLDDVSIDT